MPNIFDVLLQAREEKKTPWELITDGVDKEYGKRRLTMDKKEFINETIRLANQLAVRYELSCAKQHPDKLWKNFESKHAELKNFIANNYHDPQPAQSTTEQIEAMIGHNHETYREEIDEMIDCIGTAHVRETDLRSQLKASESRVREARSLLRRTIVTNVKKFDHMLTDEEVDDVYAKRWLDASDPPTGGRDVEVRLKAWYFEMEGVWKSRKDYGAYTELAAHVTHYRPLPPLPADTEKDNV